MAGKGGGNAGNLETRIGVDTSEVVDAGKDVKALSATLTAAFDKIETVLTNLNDTLKTLPTSIIAMNKSMAALSSAAAKQFAHTTKLGDRFATLRDQIKSSGIASKEQSLMLANLSRTYNQLTEAIDEEGIASDSAMKKQKTWQNFIDKTTERLREQREAVKSVSAAAGGSGGTGGTGGGGPPDEGDEEKKARAAVLAEAKYRKMVTDARNQLAAEILAIDSRTKKEIERIQKEEQAMGKAHIAGLIENKKREAEAEKLKLNAVMGFSLAMRRVYQHDINQQTILAEAHVRADKQIAQSTADLRRNTLSHLEAITADRKRSILEWNKAGEDMKNQFLRNQKEMEGAAKKEKDDQQARINAVLGFSAAMRQVYDQQMKKEQELANSHVNADKQMETADANLRKNTLTHLQAITEDRKRELDKWNKAGEDMKNQFLKNQKEMEAKTAKPKVSDDDKAAIKRMQLTDSAIARTDRLIASIKKSTHTEKEQAEAISIVQNELEEYVRAVKSSDVSTVKFAESTSKFNTAMRKVELGEFSKKMNFFKTGMQNITKSSQIALGPLSGVASRLQAITALFSNQSNVAIAGFVLALTALTVATVSVVRHFTMFEKQMFKVNAVIQATGRGSEITAERVNMLAESFANATLSSADMARDAAATALTFSSINSGNLEQALFAARGIEAVFGGGLQENIKKVANMLSGSEDGLNAMNEQGIRFNKIEREKIKHLAQSFQLAKAQEMIFQKINPLIQAAKSEQQGLAGAWDKALDKIGQIAAHIGQATDITGGLRDAFNNVSDTLDKIMHDEELVMKISQALKISLDAIADSIIWISENWKGIAATISAITTLLEFWVGGKILGGVIKAGVAIKKNWDSVKVVWSVLLDKAKLFKEVLTDVGNVLKSAFGIAAITTAVTVLVGKFKELSAEKKAPESLVEYNRLLKESKAIINSIPKEITTTYKLQIEGETQNNTALNDEATKLIERRAELEEKIANLKKSEDGTPGRREASYLRQIQDIDQRMGVINVKLATSNAIIGQGVSGMEKFRGEVEGAARGFSEVRDQITPISTGIKKNQIQIEEFRLQLEQLANATTEEKLYMADKFGFEKSEAGIQQMTQKLKDGIATMSDSINKAFDVSKNFGANLLNEVQRAVYESNKWLKSNGKISLSADVDPYSIKQNIAQMDLENRSRALAGRSLAEAVSQTKTQLDFASDLATVTGIQADYIGMSIIPGLRNTKDRVYEITKGYEEQLAITRQLKAQIEAMTPERALELKIDREKLIESLNNTINTITTAELDAISIPVNIGENALADYDAIIRNIQNRADPSQQTDMLSATMALMTDANTTKLAIDQAYFDQAAVIRQAYFDTDYQAYLDHMKSLNDAKQTALKATEDVEKVSFSQQLQGTAGFLGNVATVMKAGLGEQHAIYKRFAQAQILLSGADAVMSSFATGSKIGGPVVGGIFAAAAAAVVGAQLAMVESSNFASGGMIRGRGTSKSDSIPINASNGEFVMQASAVRKFGAPFMDAINAGRVPAFASGGMVGSSPISGSASGTIVEVYDQRKNGEQVEVNEETDADGVRRVQLMIRDTVNRGLYEGHFDGAMTNNYGSRRRGMR